MVNGGSLDGGSSEVFFYSIFISEQCFQTV